METFFKPVHGPRGPDEIKLRKHHHHHHHQQQDSQSHRYMMFDDTDRNPDENRGRQHRRQHRVHDDPHHNAHRSHQAPFHCSEEDEILYKQETPLTLSRASSSSLSSSSSSSSPSSFSSWYTDANVNSPFTLCHTEQPQHSLSCSNIADVRRSFREDESSEPIVFASIKQGKDANVFRELRSSSQKRGKGFSSLDRGHSRSDEGLLQGNESNRGEKRSGVPHINYGTLYKSSSLNRSLTFSDEDILLGVSRGPKRAVSSSQLPNKGILKNKEPHSDIRKAKSMEVLSPRVSKGQNSSGQKGKGNTQNENERARANVLQGKLQFSAFLDEITKQVLSPSDLTILGVNDNKVAGNPPAPSQKPNPVKPQLPPKNYTKSSGEDREQHPKQHNRREKTANSSCWKQSGSSSPDKLMAYTAKNHHGSPPPDHYPHYPGRSVHHGRTRNDRRPSSTGSSLLGDRYIRSGPHVNDGASTSPEPNQPKKRHHREQQPATSYSQHTQPFPLHQPQQMRAEGPGLGSESSSTKSDSSRARDTASTATCHSMELRCEHSSQSVRYCKQCRAAPWDADHVRALQEENADLHQNLLQTVVCIESLEEELQRTRDELSRVKEKYKSLLDTHTGTKQANNLLGEHLHIASESLSSERRYLLNRVSQLSSELEDAHKTISALENVNVQCLIKELLAKHFISAAAIHKVLTGPAPVNNPASAQADSQSHALKMEEAHNWLTQSEVNWQRLTAFTPFKQEVLQPGKKDLDQQESSCSPPFSAEDTSTAMYKKMSAKYAGTSQPLYPQSQQQISLATNHTNTPPNLQLAHVGGDNRGVKGGVQVTLLEEDILDVTSVSAQKILDGFMQQLQPHQEAREGKEQESREDGGM